MIDGLGEGKVEGSGDREGSRIRRREEGRSRNRVLFFRRLDVLVCFFFLRVGREGMGWNGMEWNGYPVLECGWVEGGVCISLAFHLLSIFF